MNLSQAYPPVVETKTELPKPPPPETTLPETGFDGFILLMVMFVVLSIGAALVGWATD